MPDPLTLAIAGAGTGAGAAGLTAGQGAALGGALTGAGALAGSLIAGGSGKFKKRSAFSKQQKEIDKAFFDWLMGIIRNGKGKEIYRDPLFTKILQKNKFRPPRPVAPLTQNQQNLIGQSSNLLNRTGNLRRTDTSFQRQLRERYGPKAPPAGAPTVPRLPGLSHGGILHPGESAVVGENKPEIAVALVGGGVQIIPNPETFSSKASIQAAISASQSASRRFGLPGMQLGSILDPAEQRRFLDVPTTDGAGNTRFYTGFGGPTEIGQEFLSEGFQPFRSGFESSEFFQDFLKTGDGRAGRSIGRFDNDIEQLATSGTRSGVVKNYFSALGNYLSGLETTTTGEGAGFLGGISGFGEEGFDPGVWNDFISKSGLGGEGERFKLGLDPTTGDLRLADPFVSTDVLQKIVDDYNKSLPPDTPPIDYSDLIGSLSGADEILDEQEANDYNAFIRTYQGGVLAPYQLRFNPTSGKTEFGDFQNGQWTPAPPNVAEGLKTSVKDFKADIAERDTALTDLNTPITADPGTTTAPIAFKDTDLVRDTNGKWTPDPTKFEQDANGKWSTVAPGAEPTVGTAASIETIKKTIEDAFLVPFDATSAIAAFEGSVENPAWRNYFDRTVPAINEAFGGINLFGSARKKANLREIERLTDKLEESRSAYMFAAEQAHKTRKLSALNTVINLEELPGRISTTAANIDRINSMTASTWSTIDINTALADASISQTQASIYAILTGVFNMEQSQNQKEFEADFLDAIETEGFSMNTLLDLLMQYQGQAQVVFAPEN